MAIIYHSTSSKKSVQDKGVPVKRLQIRAIFRKANTQRIAPRQLQRSPARPATTAVLPSKPVQNAPKRPQLTIARLRRMAARGKVLRLKLQLAERQREKQQRRR